jgi:hypothetical protein
VGLQFPQLPQGPEFWPVGLDGLARMRELLGWLHRRELLEHLAHRFQVTLGAAEADIGRGRDRKGDVGG